MQNSKRAQQANVISGDRPIAVLVGSVPAKGFELVDETIW